MKQLITKFNREKGFTYTIDKNGNVFKENYSWLKDPYTLVTIAVIILAGMYYMQVSQMKTVEKNFDLACMNYIELRNEWMKENPGQTPTIEEVVSIKKEEPKIFYEP